MLYTTVLWPLSHVVFSFWLQLLSVASRWRWSGSWRRFFCWSLRRRCLGLTGSATATRTQPIWRQKYQDLQRGGDGTGDISADLTPCHGDDFTSLTDNIFLHLLKSYSVLRSGSLSHWPVELEGWTHRQQDKRHHCVADGDLSGCPRDDIIDQFVGGWVQEVWTNIMSDLRGHNVNS